MRLSGYPTAARGHGYSVVVSRRALRQFGWAKCAVTRDPLCPALIAPGLSRELGYPISDIGQATQMIVPRGVSACVCRYHGTGGGAQQAAQQRRTGSDPHWPGML
eukprot:119069-Hanusia_phi.AAC.5